MRRAGLAILAAAALLVSAVPAWSGDDGRVAPVASLSVSPESVTAGDPVALDASGSRDADGTVASYAWDLDGDGAFERQSGAQATLAHAFRTAGTHSVAVRVLDETGESADARTSVTVTEPAPAEPDRSAAEPEPAAAEPEPDRSAAEPQPDRSAAEPEPDRSAPRAEPSRKPRATEDPARVQAAASQSVSIRDFSFAPRSVTVSVGETVTWRNTGDEAHTATARDGSFDTGNLPSGQSGSATFQKAGTFSYFCKPHPFMTGTVRVTGAGSGGSGGGGSGGGGSGGSGSGGSGGTQGVTGSGESGSGAAAGTAGGGSLPSTGLALAPFLAIGLSMIGSGVALRRRCATSRA
ncbi:MAG TPA: PKD domain-containing protein [Thermoleophilaceae bacterium]